MKKQSIIALALLVLGMQSYAQKSFKITKNSGKLILSNVSSLSIEGYDGKEIIFTGNPVEKSVEDSRAAGLSPLGSTGFDNTGLGLSVTEKNNNVYVSFIKNNQVSSLTIKVPYQVAITANATRFDWGNNTIKLSNLQSEIEVTSTTGNINFKNIKGPMSLKTVSGGIEGKLGAFKGPISLVAMDGFIDITVSDNTNADIAISNLDGALYADKNLKLIPTDNLNKDKVKNVREIIVNGKAASITIKGIPVSPIVGKADSIIIGEGAISLSNLEPADIKEIKVNKVTGYSIGSTFNGKLNDGGERLILKSNMGKIYIRK